jgi:hypothetical protein
MLEIIEYRGYQLRVGRVGKGWRASIYSPGSTSALPDSPTNLEQSRKDEIVAEAKRIIDKRLKSRSSNVYRAQMQYQCRFQPDFRTRRRRGPLLSVPKIPSGGGSCVE